VVETRLVETAQDVRELKTKWLADQTERQEKERLEKVERQEKAERQEKEQLERQEKEKIEVAQRQNKELIETIAAGETYRYIKKQLPTLYSSQGTACPASGLRRAGEPRLHGQNAGTNPKRDRRMDQGPRRPEDLLDHWNGGHRKDDYRKDRL